MREPMSLQQELALKSPGTNVADKRDILDKRDTLFATLFRTCLLPFRYGDDRWFLLSRPVHRRVVDVRVEDDRGGGGGRPKTARGSIFITVPQLEGLRTSLTTYIQI